MPAKSKVLPADIETFFGGTSVFFPPQSKTDEDGKGKPERVNGRTDERSDRTGERENNSPKPADEKATPLANKSPVSTRELPSPNTKPMAVSVAPMGAGSPSSIMERLRHGRPEKLEKTERYSFEIYPEQKEQIEDFLYQYKKRTGEKLSASRFIREALTVYFQLLDQHGSD